MLVDLDLSKPGKHFYDLTPVAGELAGITGDVMCCIANGEGPTLLLCGGIHGDEYEPQTVLRQLAETLEPEQISGRLIIIPAINYPAAQSGARISPFDGQNMNRMFPGLMGGTPTQRLAAFVTEQLFPFCDLLIDAHTGGNEVCVVPMIFGFSSEACLMGEDKLITLMEAWGYQYIQHVTGVPSTICGAALAAGVASVEIEGGGGSLDSREVATIREGILRALAAAGVMQPVLAEKPFNGVHVDAGPEAQLLAPQTGIVEHLVSLHDRVKEGSVVAHLYPLHGDNAAPLALKAPVGGVVLRQTRSAFAKEGQLVMNLGVVRTG